MRTSEQAKLFEYYETTQKSPIHSQVFEKLENNENSKAKTFKALIRETSVYKYFVELKKDVLTSKNYLNFEKVHGLFLAKSGQFLRELRLKHQRRLKDIAKIVGVSKSLVSDWEHNRRKIPFIKLVKIAEVSGVPKETINSLIDQGVFAPKNINLTIKFEKVRDIVHHFSPQTVGHRVSLINCSKETLSNIKDKFKMSSLSSSKYIKSKNLHNYLKTFFRYIKIPKIHPPLTSEVKHWYENGVDLKNAIIIPCLQSDGGIEQHRYPRLQFFGKNKSLHDYFVDAMYFEYNELPSSYLNNRGTCYGTGYRRKAAKGIIDEVMNLAGNSKTSPANRQSVEDYLSEPQPHLNYLINTSKIEQQIALRIWASTEGSITMCKQKGYIVPDLTIACSHPDIVTQLQQIARQCNINFTKRRIECNWSGISGLYTRALSSCREFLKLGNFLKGVSISSKSSYHKGIDKDILLLGILEVIIREKSNHQLSNLSLKEIHNEINKIIENKEYNTIDYYINFFS